MHLKQNACFTLESRARGAAATSHFKAQPAFLADKQAEKAGTAPENSYPPSSSLDGAGRFEPRLPHARQRRPTRASPADDQIRHPSCFLHGFKRNRLFLTRKGGGFPVASSGQRPLAWGSLLVLSSSRQNPLTYSLGAKTAFPFRRREAPRSRAGVATGPADFPFGSGRVARGRGGGVGRERGGPFPLASRPPSEKPGVHRL